MWDKASLKREFGVKVVEAVPSMSWYAVESDELHVAGLKPSKQVRDLLDSGAAYCVPNFKRSYVSTDGTEFVMVFAKL